MTEAVETTETREDWLESCFNEYEMPIEKMDALRDRVAKVNARGAKLGLDANLLTLEEGETIYRKVTTKKLDEFGEPIVETYAFVVVTVTGTIPKLGDYRFIATIDHSHSKALIRRLDTELEIPARYITNDSFCEHCNTKRNRKETFVIYEESTGNYLRVGRNCLIDYIPSWKPADLVRIVAWASTGMDDLVEEGIEGTGGGPRTVFTPLMEYLPHVAVAIRQYGWLSNSAARYREDAVSSSGRAWDNIYTIYGDRKATKADRDAVRPTDADMLEALAAIEWAKGLEVDPTENEYLYTLNVIATDGHFKAGREAGYAAAMVMSYQKEMEKLKEMEREKAKSNEWFGEIKERLTLTLTVVKKRNIDGYYGVTVLHTMEDADGNSFKWFCSGEPLELDETVTVKGTVKKHEEYKGRKSTMLARVAKVK